MNNIFRTDDIFKNGFPIRLYRISHAMQMKEHSHEYMQIWYVMQGCCTHIVENVKYKLSSKSLLVIPPYIAHSIEDETDDIIIIGCEFPVEVVTQDSIMSGVNGSGVLSFTYAQVFEAAIMRTKPCYTPSIKCQLQIERLMENMLRELCEKEKHYEISLKSDLLKLLTVIARDYEVNNNSKKIAKSYRKLIGNAIAYINDNYRSKLYIEDAAKTATMSESYFSYFFKETTGQTFTEYINAFRIEKAKELLERSDLSIAEIAAEVGFGENAYFNKVFKKEVSCTPFAYRRMILEKH